MNWTQTHRRMDALSEAEAALKAIPDQVPWRPEYEELFGTPEGLVEALRYRWRLRLQAQLDPGLGAAALAESAARLRQEMPSLIAKDLLPGEPPAAGSRARRCPGAFGRRKLASIR